MNPQDSFQRVVYRVRAFRTGADAKGPLAAAGALLAFAVILVLLLPLLLITAVVGALIGTVGLAVVSVKRALGGRADPRGPIDTGRRNVRVIEHRD